MLAVDDGADASAEKAAEGGKGGEGGEGSAAVDAVVKQLVADRAIEVSSPVHTPTP